MTRTLSRGARPSLAAGVLLAALVLVPGLSFAQDVPELPSAHSPEYKQIALEVQSTFVEVPYRGRVTVDFTVRDLSRDSTRQPGAEGAPAVGPGRNSVIISMEPEGRQLPGWTASTTLSAAFLFGGESVRAQYFVQTAGSVRDQYAHYWLNATMTLPNGSQVTESERITARLLPFYRGMVQVLDASQTVGQYEKVHFDVEVFNGGAYPDTFLLNVTAPPGYQAHITPKVYVQPFETRIVNLTLKTPKDKVYDFGTPATVVVNMKSANDPANYQGVASLYVRGAYIPSYWTPVTLLALLCFGLLVRRSQEERETRRLERGLPRRPRPTPRQAVVLKELKKRDKDAYDARAERLRSVYAGRRAVYREQHKDHARREREQRKVARVELKQERRDRKIARKEEKARAKEEAARERVHRKEVRKRRKVLEKEKAKLEKQRAKLQKKEDKRAAREAKAQAKRDAKQAKADAREAKKQARAAKRAKKKQ